MSKDFWAYAIVWMFGALCGCLLMDWAHVPEGYDRMTDMRLAGNALVNKCEEHLPRDQHCEVVLSARAVPNK